jgi:alpha-D-xyloside xylohydrolase
MGNLSMFSQSLLIDDPRLDYFVIYGPSLKEVLARYEEITGWPAFPPKKSFGVWFKTHGSDTGDTGPIALAKKFRGLGLPVDFFTHVVSVRASNRAAELALARQLSAELAKFGIVIGMYASPRMEDDWEIAKEALARGFVLTQSDGTPYRSNMGGGQGTNKPEESIAATERDDAWRDLYYKVNNFPFLLPDFTNPAVVTWWKGIIGDLVKAGCYGSGMSDFGEDVPPDAHYFNKRSGLEMHNFYTMLYQKYTYEAIAENAPDHRALINARSGTTGLQRFPICWSGDPNSEWDDMASALRSGLSIGLSGVPFWSNDISGYTNTPGLSTELYIRWMQMAMFQSHVRFNGTPQRNPWTFGDRAVENYKKYANLRYSLLPYIYSHAYNATKTGLPMIRAMVLEFQSDPSTYNLQDQYMFGDAFLVAPIFKLVNKRNVYLPKGTWHEYETGKEYSGPDTIHIEPSLDVLPVFVRDNSIIPMGPEMMYIGEKPANLVTLDVWLSSEAKFTMYDDDERAHTQEIVDCHAAKKGNQIALNVGASGKTFIAKFNKTSRPKQVSVNGKDVQHVASRDALEKAESGWYFDPSSVVYAKFNPAGSATELVLHF